MKKVLMVLSIMMFYGIQSFAQEKEKTEKSKFFVGVTIGVSAPVGVFGSTDTASIHSGLARAGYNLNLNAGYQIKDHFGLAANIFYSRFKLDQTSVEKYIGVGSVSDVNASADHWQYLGLEVGPKATVLVSDNVFVDFKGLLGFAYANMPVYRFELQGLPSLAVVTSEEWNYTFTWRLGAGLRYNFTKGACFLANADYNYMRPIWRYDVPGNGGTVRINDEQRIGSLDLNVGVGVTL